MLREVLLHRLLMVIRSGVSLPVIATDSAMSPTEEVLNLQEGMRSVRHVDTARQQVILMQLVTRS